VDKFSDNPENQSPAYPAQTSAREDIALENSPNLNLPYIMPAQAQKHVTHNEAVTMLDGLVQLATITIATTPPASPQEGDRYIVGPAPTGDWASHEHSIASFQDGAWLFHSPMDGWIAFNLGDSTQYVFLGGTWTALSSGGSGGGTGNTASIFGINTTADTTNRLQVESDGSLFSHDGSDHRMYINRAASTDQAAVLFQTAFQTDAELGVSGSGDMEIKTPDTASALQLALQVSHGSGAVSYPRQPACKVTANAGFVTVDNDNQVLAFDTPIFDRTQSFNAATHSYAVPESGIYLVCANLFTFQGTSLARVAIAKNGIALQETIRHFDQLDAMTVCEIVDVSAGDTLDLRTASTHGRLEYFGFHSNLSFMKIA
jgi:hypothetical protein